MSYTVGKLRKRADCLAHLCGSQMQLIRIKSKARNVFQNDSYVPHFHDTVLTAGNSRLMAIGDDPYCLPELALGKPRIRIRTWVCVVCLCVFVLCVCLDRNRTSYLMDQF